MSGEPDLWQAVLPVVDAFDALSAKYYIGGHDLQGVLRVQGQTLNLEYLRTWASRLGLAELLLRALDEAGLGG